MQSQIKRGAKPMRRFTVKIIVLILLVLGGWWWIATSSLQNNLLSWLDSRRSEGWQADVGEMSRGGFPLRIASTLSDTTIADPETALVLNIPQLALSTPIYWPGHVTLTLPAEPIVISTPQGAVTISSDGAEAALRLHPGTSLQLEALTAASTHLSFDLVEGRALSVQTLQANIEQGLEPETYNVDLVATGFAPGSVIRQTLRLPAAWPETFETLLADMTVTFDRPWDRSALETQRPQPRAITVDQITAVWADLSLTFGADLQIEPGGTASGTANLRAHNWQRMLDLASASGALSPQARSQSESILNLLSGLSGTAETLDVEITIDKGQMRMGFIPLGAAPRIILR
jgi:hypothetical protein